MRIINKDLTQEKVSVYTTNHQIYVKIWSKVHGRWTISTYFQSYDWEIDDSIKQSTIKYIVRTWNLKNPKITIE